MKEQAIVEPDKEIKGEFVFKLVVDGKEMCGARTQLYSHLLSITTIKGEEGKGYGKKLLSHIEELAKKNGAPTMMTSDIDKCAYETVCFFKSMGYRFKPDEQNGQFIEATKDL